MVTKPAAVWASQDQIPPGGIPALEDVIGDGQPPRCGAFLKIGCKSPGVRYHQVDKTHKQDGGGLFKQQGVARQAIARQGDKSTKFGKQGAFMSDRLEFDIDCPNNHNQTVTFSQEEFEETLKSGALMFHCNTCDTDWPPSGEEIAKFRKRFSKNSS